jgi:capsular polysaccharide biosynthesis protein/MinD-like ATPase involved in chromosome partitioning or flagellar assembly
VAEDSQAKDRVARLEPREPSTEQPVDVGRYANALARNRVLIALIVIGLSAVVLTLSLALPKTYKATARILLDESPGITESSSDVERRLATIQALLTTRGVLTRAAGTLEGESADTLEDKVRSSVDAKANIVNVQATDSSGAGAAEIANAVAAAFLRKQGSVERRRLARTIAVLNEQITGLRGPRTEIEPIRARLNEQLSDLRVNQANAGSDLQLADAARPSGSPDSPRPVRNTIFAFFAGLFLAVLVAVARERIAPRVSGPRQLSELSGLPVLTNIRQAHRSRFGGDGGALAKRDAYQTLSAIIGLQLGPGRPHTLLVTSALEDEGTTEVTAGLGRALALAGEKTLVVRADMRRLVANELAGEAEPGLAEILSAPGRERREAAAEMLADPTSSVSAGDGAGSLAVLGTGHTPSNPARLLSGDALDVFFKELERSDYTYVLIEGPPLLGLADCRYWAQRVEGTLVVSRLDRLEPNDVIELRELLERLDAHALGHVIVNGRAGPV